MKTFINYKDCLLYKKEGRESLWCAEFKFYRMVIWDFDLMVFRCFQGVEKGCTGNKRVKL